MNKEFIPYEQALELREVLGFDEPCLASWNFYTNELNYNAYPSKFSSGDVIPLPTFSQAFRWFREKHGICGYVSPLEDGSAFYHMIYTNINVPYSNRICTLPEKWETYEEAELACLRKLIEITKQGDNKC